jgi:pimeloyl-ACP methyl ester carboxylesterase
VPGRRSLIAALALAGVAAAVAGGVGARAFARDLAAARRRVAGRSAVVDTPFGKVEFAQAGSGPPLLVSHGTGGGFDMALAMPGGLVERGLQVIAPSRFGYLRSDFPADPSPGRQADEFAALLDHLRVERVVVAGGSAGAVPALHFAARHPQRCRGLVLLVPAANTRGHDPVAMGPALAWIVRRLLASDLAFWLALRAAPELLIGTLLATDPALLRTVEPAERARAHRILAELMPIGERARGMLNDARIASEPLGLDLHGLDVPTLVVSAEDDRFGTAGTARDIAARMPRARLSMLPSGGHVWLGHEREVADAVAAFVRAT